MSEDARARKVAAALAAALAAFGGVGCRGTATNDPVPAWSSLYLLTERERQIALDIGWKESDLERMGSEGIELREYNSILYAEALLDHLEEKYGLELRATGMGMPSYGSSSYRLSARVVGGRYSGVECECHWVFADPKDTYYEDNLLSQARGDELVRWYEDRLWACRIDKYGGVYAVSRPSMYLREENGMDVTTAELAEILYNGIDLYFPPDCGLSEQEHAAVVDGVVASIQSECPGSKALLDAYHIIRLTDACAGEPFSTQTASVAATGYQSAEGETYEWHLRGRVFEWGEGDEH